MARRLGNSMAGLAAALAALAGVSALAHSADASTELLRQRIEQLLIMGHLEIQGATVAKGELLAKFYERRNFAPAWSPAEAAEWLERLEAIDADGLRPTDYYIDELERMQAAQPATERATVDWDLLLSASFLRAGRDLRFGKVDPASLAGEWQLRRELDPGSDAIETLETALAAPALGRLLDERLPRPTLYRQLQEALRQYRDIARHGGWPSLPAGGTLRPGDSDPRIAVLRERLTMTGDYAPAVPSASAGVLDAQLEAAVRQFQERHGLAVDGVVGNATRTALNVPVAERIDQIRLNLERGRWVLGALDERFLVVNIASFQIFLVEHDKPIWTARTQVGRAYRQTPVFRGMLEYIELNPTWTIPPTILREDILPRAAADAAYLDELGIDVLSLDGAPVDARTVDWANVVALGFPYMLRQRAGPGNLLGRVKFIFPNEHFVFLHDTPSQTLFDAPARTFSSGCIRVENALELAELVLDDPDHWSRAAIEAALASNATLTVHLDMPLPVLVLYWTASIDDAGRLRFLPDIYGRDARLLAALDAPPADS